MKTKESLNDQIGTYITGFIYTIVLAIILLLICFIFNEKWFDNDLTSILISIVCGTFFLIGLKKVKEQNIGFLRMLGRRDFEESFAEGWWWIFPLWSFKQKPHYDKLNEAEELKEKFITKDKIPLDINVKYYWQLKDLKNIDNRYTSSFLKDKLKHELGIFVRSRAAIELLTDEEISNKVMSHYLVVAGENIGITISDVFPNINFETEFIPVLRKFQVKYEKLEYEFNSSLRNLQIKAIDMSIFEFQIKECIKNLNFTSEEALSFMKIYKNKVNMAENTLNFNLNELNKLIDRIVAQFKN